MIANKHISAIVTVLVVLSMLLCLCGMAYADTLNETLGGTKVRMEYETELFDTNDIISIDLHMDEDEWNTMLDNATSEVYYKCDVTVNSKTFYNVGIRPKGNTSLSAIATDPDNDRYSFKLEFDQFVDGQTCFGLDKLILNNNYADATNLKEAVIYDMYKYLDVNASLYNYAAISLNGEYWGVYLALEAVEDSFMLRNFGVHSGELYKPESMDMGGGGMGGAPGGKDFDPSQAGNFPDSFDKNQIPEGFDASDIPDGFDPQQFGGNMPPESENGEMPDMSDFDAKGMGGFSMGGSGANLNYTDDELDSYSTIWDGSVTDSTAKDHRRVVTALKNISEGNDLETYLDVDNILKYMAVHSFAVNEDSLSGSMAHNYYLYEYNGQLNIFPWDYNLSFGGMSMGSSGGAEGMINDPIDTPFSGTEFFDTLLENDEYLAIYHEYYSQLVSEYVKGGKFDEFYDRIRTQIDSLVQTDPNSMYTYDEYKTAAQMLYNTVQLRSDSIIGQLNGEIPSTSAGQKEDSSALIDASLIDVEAMGTFSMGGMGKNVQAPSVNNKNTRQENAQQDTYDSEDTQNQTGIESGSTKDSSGISENFDPSQMGKDIPEGFDPSQLSNKTPEGFDPSQAGNMPEGFDPSQDGNSTQE
ncbi:MAG: CotH kinase family protein, partial [Oscillospiraceae bacterium]|nr:CotH kinase family protein [Oscillospiraceae bacterium]